MLIKIPLEIVELDDTSFHLFVEGFVNGQKCHFIIDTGASKTVFALNQIQHLLLESPISQPDIQSAGITAASMDSHTGIISKFTMGNFVFLDMPIILIDLSSIDELYRNFSEKTIWGLIGSDFLLTYKAKLDYGNKTLTLKVPKSNFTEQQ
jgi:hypothetical protein